MSKHLNKIKMQELKEEKETMENELIKKQYSREHLANERTLLAWIRTSIGIMAFGFVVVKFSLFIKQISLLLGKDATIPQHGYSSVIGILLVAVGAIILVLSYVKYNRTEKQLANESFKPSSGLILWLTIIILIISILLILYLVESTMKY
jgi:putative membrane protein